MKRGAFIMHEEKITRTEFEAVRPDYNSEISAVIRGNDTPKVMQKQTWGLPRKRHRGGYPTALGRWMQETLSGMFGRNSVGCFWASWGSAGGRVSRRNGFKATSHKAFAQIAPSDFSSDCTSSTSAGWRLPRRTYERWQKICKQGAYKARALYGVAILMFSNSHDEKLHSRLIAADSACI